MRSQVKRIAKPIWTKADAERSGIGSVKFFSLQPVFLCVYSRDYNNSLILGFLENEVDFANEEEARLLFERYYPSLASL